MPFELFIQVRDIKSGTVVVNQTGVIFDKIPEGSEYFFFFGIFVGAVSGKLRRIFLPSYGDRACDSRFFRNGRGPSVLRRRFPGSGFSGDRPALLRRRRNPSGPFRFVLTRILIVQKLDLEDFYLWISQSVPCWIL